MTKDSKIFIKHPNYLLFRNIIISFVFFFISFLSIIILPTFSFSVKADDNESWIDYAEESFEGSGTETDPYLIQNAFELAGFSSKVNRGFYYNAYFKLENDIDLSAHIWLPIGNSVFKFNGYFDGNNKVINGLRLNDTVFSLEYGGLFGCVFDAMIFDLTLENINISISDSQNAGGLIGYAGGYVEIYNCSVYGSIIDISSTSFASGIGGIIGKADELSLLKVNNCVNNVEIQTSNLKASVGGILGESLSTDLNLLLVSNYADINAHNIAGGIVGKVASISLNCGENFGKITAYNLSGGIVGNTVLESIIINVLNKGVVESNNFAGGIIGYASSSTSVSNSVNLTTNVVSQNFIGGIAGNVVATSNCYFIRNLQIYSAFGLKVDVGGVIDSDQQNDILTYQGLEFGKYWTIFEENKEGLSLSIKKNDALEVYAVSNNIYAGTVENCGGIYNEGDEIILKVLKTSETFIGWFFEGNCVSSDSQYSFTLNKQNAGLYIAKFSERIYFDMLDFESVTQNNNTYILNNLKNLSWFVNSVNGTGGLSAYDFANKNVMLNFSPVLYNYEWVSIGTLQNPFKGNFNGQDNIIYGLSLNSFNFNDSCFSGFFGNVSSVNNNLNTIQNIKFYDVKTNINSSGHINFGVLVGKAENIVFDNIYIDGNINIVAQTGNLASIIGVSQNVTVEDCFVYSDIYAVFKNSSVYFVNSSFVGSFIGFSSEFNIKNSSNFSDVFVRNALYEKNSAIGGFVGCGEGYIINSSDSGNIVSNLKMGELVGSGVIHDNPIQTFSINTIEVPVSNMTGNIGLFEATPLSSYTIPTTLWNDCSDFDSNYNFSDGNGTVNNPYKIYSDLDFAFIFKDSNNLSKYYILMNDINLSDNVWSGSEDEFLGVFDGKGYSVSGLIITDLTVSNSIFGKTNGAVIKNTKFVNVVVDLKTKITFGTIAERFENSTLINCSVINLTIKNFTAKPLFFGGVVGLSIHSVIERTSFISSDFVVYYFDTPIYVGGITAFAIDSKIYMCQNQARFDIVVETYSISPLSSFVDVNEYLNTDPSNPLNQYDFKALGFGTSFGLIAAVAKNTMLEQNISRNSSKVTVNSVYGIISVGSIVGLAQFATIRNCLAEKIITLNYDETNPDLEIHFGAIAGYADYIVTGCYNPSSNISFVGYGKLKEFSVNFDADIWDISTKQLKFIDEFSISAMTENNLKGTVNKNINSDITTLGAEAINGFEFFHWTKNGVYFSDSEEVEIENLSVNSGVYEAVFKKKGTWSEAIEEHLIHNPDFTLSGQGSSSSNPYLITSAYDLAYLAYMVNNGGFNNFNYYKITASEIDLKDFSWTPIGINSTFQFKGFFDGNGVKILNLYIESSPDTTHYGLFGIILSENYNSFLERSFYSQLENINIENAFIEINDYTLSSEMNIGIVAGFSNIITNCHATGQINYTNSSIGYGETNIPIFIGGISGFNIYLNNCSFEGNIEVCVVDGFDYFGNSMVVVSGVSGFSYFNVTASFNGKITIYSSKEHHFQKSNCYFDSSYDSTYDDSYYLSDEDFMQKNFFSNNVFVSGICAYAVYLSPEMVNSSFFFSIGARSIADIELNLIFKYGQASGLASTFTNYSNISYAIVLEYLNKGLEAMGLESELTGLMEIFMIIQDFYFYGKISVFNVAGVSEIYGLSPKGVINNSFVRADFVRSKIYAGVLVSLMSIYTTFAHMELTSQDFYDNYYSISYYYYCIYSFYYNCNIFIQPLSLTLKTNNSYAIVNIFQEKYIYDIDNVNVFKSYDTTQPSGFDSILKNDIIFKIQYLEFLCSPPVSFLEYYFKSILLKEQIDINLRFFNGLYCFMPIINMLNIMFDNLNNFDFDEFFNYEVIFYFFTFLIEYALTPFIFIFDEEFIDLNIIEYQVILEISEVFNKIEMESPQILINSNSLYKNSFVNSYIIVNGMNINLEFDYNELIDIEEIIFLLLEKTESLYIDELTGYLEQLDEIKDKLYYRNGLSSYYYSEAIINDISVISQTEDVNVLDKLKNLSNDDGFNFEYIWYYNTDPNADDLIKNDGYPILGSLLLNKVINIQNFEEDNILAEKGVQFLKDGDEVIFKIAPLTGYEFKRWLFNGSVVQEDDVYSIDQNGYLHFISSKQTAGQYEAIFIEVPAPEIKGFWYEYIEPFSEGTGSKNNPYRISTPEQLGYMASQLNLGITYQDEYFILTSDLYLNDHYWNYITDTTFMGNFNGNNKSLYGLEIYSSDIQLNCYGLFATCQNASISNLTIFEPKLNISGDGNNSPVYIGILAGRLDDSDIFNISVIYSTIKVDLTNCDLSIGGIIGYLSGNSNMLNCYNMSNEKTGEEYLGENYQHIYIKTNYSSCVGGLVGSNYGQGLIKNSFNSRNIYVEQNLDNGGLAVGGLIGYTSHLDNKIDECYNSGNITIFNNLPITNNECIYVAGITVYGSINEDNFGNFFQTGDITVYGNTSSIGLANISDFFQKTNKDNNNVILSDIGYSTGIMTGKAKFHYNCPEYDESALLSKDDVWMKLSDNDYPVLKKIAFYYDVFIEIEITGDKNIRAIIDNVSISGGGFYDNGENIELIIDINKEYIIFEHWLYNNNFLSDIPSLSFEAQEYLSGIYTAVFKVLYWTDVASESFEGEGTEESPYQISTANDLALLSKISNDPSLYDEYYDNIYDGAYFIFNENIDLSGRLWTSIVKNYSFNFSSFLEFDVEESLEIRGLTIYEEASDEYNCFGLFGVYIHRDAFFKTIILDDLDITVFRPENMNLSLYVGGFVGYTPAYMNYNVYCIPDCKASGKINVVINSNPSMDISSYIGGIAGYSSLFTCYESSVNVTVKVEKDSVLNNYINNVFAGGMFGEIYAHDIFNSCRILSDYDGVFTFIDKGNSTLAYIGGVVGKVYFYSWLGLKSLSIVNRSVLNLSLGSGTYYIGGVAGYNDSISYPYFSNYGEVNISLNQSVNVNGEFYIGGAVGCSESYKSFSGSNYASLNINLGSEDNYLDADIYIGGVVGKVFYEYYYGNIEYANNIGEINVYAYTTQKLFLGGVFGGGGSAVYSINIGSIRAKIDALEGVYFGGIAGYALKLFKVYSYGTISSCWEDIGAFVGNVENTLIDFIDYDKYFYDIYDIYDPTIILDAIFLGKIRYLDSEDPFGVDGNIPIIYKYNTNYLINIYDANPGDDFDVESFYKSNVLSNIYVNGSLLEGVESGDFLTDPSMWLWFGWETSEEIYNYYYEETFDYYSNLIEEVKGIISISEDSIFSYRDVTLNDWYRKITSEDNWISNLINYMRNYTEDQPKYWYEDEGEGTAESPYLITNEYQLAYLSYNSMNFWYMHDKHLYFSLESDLDLSGYEWIPISVFNSYYNQSLTSSITFITFNGNGHTISNLTMSGEKDFEYAGLFGYISSNCSIENLTLSDVNIDVELQTIFTGYRNPQLPSQVYAGAFVGYVGGNANITNCHIENGNIVVRQKDNNKMSSLNAVGGFVGYTFGGNILNCTNNANVEGYANISFDNPDVTTAQKGNDLMSVGGFVGLYQADDYYNQPHLKFENCENFGEVKSSVVAGGILGSALVSKNWGNFELKILNSTNNGNIESYQFTGGLIGYINGNDDYRNIKLTLTNSTNNGDIINVATDFSHGYTLRVNSVSDLKDNFAGGLVGYLFGNLENSTIEECLNTGNISVVLLQEYDIDKIFYVGGLVAKNDYITINDCINYNNFYIDNNILGGKLFIGQACGYSEDEQISNCIFVALNVTYFGNKVYDNELLLNPNWTLRKKIAVYFDYLDFENKWTLFENFEQYPSFKTIDNNIVYIVDKTDFDYEITNYGGLYSNGETFASSVVFDSSKYNFLGWFNTNTNVLMSSDITIKINFNIDNSTTYLTPKFAEKQGPSTYLNLSADGYYLIYNVQDLIHFNNNYFDDLELRDVNKFRLMNDINISNINWNPVMDFTGEFDGNNKKIIGFTSNKSFIRQNEVIFALFGSAQNAYIHNLSLTSVNINIILDRCGNVFISSVIGCDLGNNVIKNCKIIGSNLIQVSGTASNLFVGGLISGNTETHVLSTSTVSDSSVSLNIVVLAQIKGSIYVGGIATAISSIENSKKTLDIYVNTSDNSYVYAGGLAAFAKIVNNCINSGDVSVENSGNNAISIVGGLVAGYRKLTYEFIKGDISKSNNLGEISALSYIGFAGGLIGLANTTYYEISLCNNYGFVKANNSAYAAAGGFVGAAEFINIYLSTNNANVQANNSAGGFIGVLFNTVNTFKDFEFINYNSIIQNVVNSGIISSSNNSGLFIGTAKFLGIFNSINVGKLSKLNHSFIIGSDFDDDIYSNENISKLLYLESYNTSLFEFQNVFTFAESTSLLINDVLNSFIIGDVNYLTTTQMRNKNNFLSLDFVNIWELSSINGYPTIKKDASNASSLSNPVSANTYNKTVVEDDVTTEDNTILKLSDFGNSIFMPVSTLSGGVEFELWTDGDNFASGFSEGSGTSADPYIISSATELAYLAKTVNQGNSYVGKYIKISDDVEFIDLSAYYWEPIGVVSDDVYNIFSGSFDGNNKVIKNLKISSKATISYVYGLFGYCLFASITNIIIEDLDINVDSNDLIILSKSDSVLIGGICAYAVYLSLEMLNSSFFFKFFQDMSYFIFGYDIHFKLYDAISKINISSYKLENLGISSGDIIIEPNILNYNDISIDFYCGGVIGMISNSNIDVLTSKLYNSATILLKAYEYGSPEVFLGGVIGSYLSLNSIEYESSVSQSYNTGDILVLQGDRLFGFVGGLIGLFSSVNLENYEFVLSAGSITNSYNIGMIDVFDIGDGTISGIACTMNTIYNCYNFGNIIKNDTHPNAIFSIGGMCIGWSPEDRIPADIYNCYASAIHEGFTSELDDDFLLLENEMNNPAFFTNFSDEIWAIDPNVNNGYPYLKAHKVYMEFVLTVSLENCVVKADDELIDGFIIIGSGKSITLEAIADTGHTFVGWYVNGVLVSDNLFYEITIDKNTKIFAKAIILNNKTITVASSDINRGNVMGGGVYNSTSTATIKAVANNTTIISNKFLYWENIVTGAIFSYESIVSFVVTENLNLRAVFDRVDNVFEWKDTAYSLVLEQNSKYVLNNMEELIWFMHKVNGTASFEPFDFADKIVILNFAPNLSSLNWTPIGSAENPFRGTFDGSYNIVKNLTFMISNKTNNNSYAFFGYIANAVVKNIIFSNIVINSYNNEVDLQLSVVALQAVSSTIENCDIYLSVRIPNSVNFSAVALYSEFCKFYNIEVSGEIVIDKLYESFGLLFGKVVRGYISDCISNANISINTSESYTIISAIVAEIEFETRVENCLNLSYLEVFSSAEELVIAGIVGKSKSFNYITASKNMGIIDIEASAKKEIQVGGILGKTTNIAEIFLNSSDTYLTYVESCVNTANIEFYTSNINCSFLISGIANGANIINCYNTGNLVFDIIDDNLLYNLISMVAVSSIGSGYIENCYSFNNINVLRFNQNLQLYNFIAINNISAIKKSEVINCYYIYNNDSIKNAQTVVGKSSYMFNVYKIDLSDFCNITTLNISENIDIKNIMKLNYDLVWNILKTDNYSLPVLSKLTDILFISAISENTSYGTVTAGGTFNENGGHVLSATAKTDYKFDYWTKNGFIISYDKIIYVGVHSTNNNNLYIAHFSRIAPTTSSAKVLILKEGNGVVEIEGNSDISSIDVNLGDQITLKAISTELDLFLGWFDGNFIVSNSNIYSFTVRSNITYIAKFTHLIDFTQLPTSEITKDKPKIILNNESDLSWFVNTVNGTNGFTAYNFEGTTVVLNFDIDLTDVLWTPIGSAENPFMGTFDGNFRLVKNLYIYANYIYSGFFGYVKGEIKNLRFINSNINASRDSAVSVGTVAGSLIGKVENLDVTSGSLNVYSKDQIYAGGIIGYLEGESYNLASIVTLNIKSVTTNNNVVVSCGGLFGYVKSNSKIDSGLVVSKIMVEKISANILQDSAFGNVPLNSDISNIFVQKDLTQIQRTGFSSYFNEFQLKLYKTYDSWTNFQSNWEMSAQKAYYPILKLFLNVTVILKTNLKNSGIIYLSTSLKTSTESVQVDIKKSGQIFLVAEEYEGFTFSHWLVNGEIVSTERHLYYIVTDNTTEFIAMFESNTYDITVIDDDESEIKIISVMIGDTLLDKLQALNIERVGQYIKNWHLYNKDGEIVTQSIVVDDTILGFISNELEVYIEWENAEITILFDSYGGLPISYARYIEYGTNLGALYEPIKQNFNFSGWFTEINGAGERILEDTQIYSSMTLYAYWVGEVKTIIVNYNQQEGIISGGGDYHYQDIAVISAKPKNGYSFSYFVYSVKGNDIYVYDPLFYITVLDDYDISVEFEQLTYIVEIYSQKVNDIIAGEVSVVYYPSGDSVEGFSSNQGGEGVFVYDTVLKLSALAFSGYNFVGWYSQNSYLGLLSEYHLTIERNISIIAVFGVQSANLVNLKLTSNDIMLGDVNIIKGEKNIVSVKNSLVTVVAITKDTSEFKGWYKNDILISTDKNYTFKLTENTSLKGVFTPAYFDLEKTVQPSFVNNVYLISSVKNLLWLCSEVNKGVKFAGQRFLLTQSLNISAAYWTPIGNAQNSFEGEFDGGGFSISGLRVFANSEDYFGLFGYVYKGTIKNLSLNNINIYLVSDVISRNVAGLVGCLRNSKISTCQVDGVVYGHIAQDDYVGGVTACLLEYSEISMCSVIVDFNIKVSGGYVGGLVASCEGTVSESFVSGGFSAEFDGEEDIYLGGLVGVSSSGAYIYNTFTALTELSVIGKRENVNVTSFIAYVDNSELINNYYFKINNIGAITNIADQEGSISDKTLDWFQNESTYDKDSGYWHVGVGHRAYTDVNWIIINQSYPTLRVFDKTSLTSITLVYNSNKNETVSLQIAVKNKIYNISIKSGETIVINNLIYGNYIVRANSSYKIEFSSTSFEINEDTKNIVIQIENSKNVIVA